MSRKPKLLLPLFLIVAGIVLFYFPVFLEYSPLVEVTSKCFSFLCLSIGIGWLYTAIQPKQSGSKHIPKLPLKILDWALIVFCLAMIAIMQTLGLPSMFWLLFLGCSVFGRMLLTWWILRSDYLKPYKVEKIYAEHKLLIFGLAFIIAPMVIYGLYTIYAIRYGKPRDPMFFEGGQVVEGIQVEPVTPSLLVNLIFICFFIIGLSLCIISGRAKKVKGKS